MRALGWCVGWMLDLYLVRVIHHIKIPRLQKSVSTISVSVSWPMLVLCLYWAFRDRHSSALDSGGVIWPYVLGENIASQRPAGGEETAEERMVWSVLGVAEPSD